MSKKQQKKSASVEGPIVLPDSLPVPFALSDLAARLFTLRHLAAVAASTQPSREATEGYKSLQRLGWGIERLQREHAAQPKSAGTDDLRLIARLRDRLTTKYIKGSKRSIQSPASAGPVVSSGGGDQVMRVPMPQGQKSTRTNSAIGQLSDETRWLPTLSM